MSLKVGLNTHGAGGLLGLGWSSPYGPDRYFGLTLAINVMKVAVGTCRTRSRRASN